MKEWDWNTEERGEKVHTWKTIRQVERRGMKIRNKLLSPRKCSCFRNHNEITGHDDIIVVSYLCLCLKLNDVIKVYLIYKW